MSVIFLPYPALAEIRPSHSKVVQHFAAPNNSASQQSGYEGKTQINEQRHDMLRSGDGLFWKADAAVRRRIARLPSLVAGAAVTLGATLSRAKHPLALLFVLAAPR